MILPNGETKHPCALHTVRATLWLHPNQKPEVREVQASTFFHAMEQVGGMWNKVKLEAVPALIGGAE